MTAIQYDIRRVTKQHPCPVCGRPDWCGVMADGSACICMREPDGAVKSTRNGGYLHRLRDESFPRYEHRVRSIRINIPKPASPNLERFAKQLQDAVDPDRLCRFAADLGLSSGSLRRLGIGWLKSQSAWCFPLSDARGRVVGIQQRFADGSKRVMSGHRAGLYRPAGLPDDLTGRSLMICEGGTDTTVALDLGFEGVGRFSCTHGADLLIDLIQSRRPETVVIVADSKPIEREGADALAAELLPYVRVVKVIHPPASHKDLRAWKQDGATQEDIQRRIDEVSSLTPSVHIVTRGN